MIMANKDDEDESEDVIGKAEATTLKRIDSMIYQRKKPIVTRGKGAFTPEEDECLIVAVLLFGRTRNQITRFVPGQTQAQCRDRYVNSLDPRLKWGAWTLEEDSRLKAIIVKNGFFWTKVAAEVAARTDSQCRKHELVFK